MDKNTRHKVAQTLRAAADVLAAPAATASQVSYLKHLAKQLGLKRPTSEEIEALTRDEASDLIGELKEARGEAEWYPSGQFRRWRKSGETPWSKR